MAWFIEIVSLPVDARYLARPANSGIGDDTPAGQAFAKRSKGPLDFCPAEQNVIRPGHAASRSLADKYTPCLRNAAGAQTSASARWVSSSPGNHGR